MMLTEQPRAAKLLLHYSVVTVAVVVLSLSVTGGEAFQTVLLVIPFATVFVLSGFVGGLLAVCGSLSATTGVYALMNLFSGQVPIPPGVTYIAVSLAAFAIALAWRHSPLYRTSTESVETIPFAVGPLLIALISGYLVIQWTRISDLEFLNALAGSEDNASWITGTRTVVAGQMTTDFMSHYTNSPVTGSTLSFMSDVYWIVRSDVPEHLLALRALRSAYALIVSLTAMAAGVWVAVVASRAKTDRSLGLIASLVVAVAVLGSSLYLFLGVGFFSFVNGILFALVVAIGFEVVFSQSLLTPQLEGVLILVLCGFGGAWMGVAPLAAVLVVVVATTSGARARWFELSRLGLAKHLCIYILAISTLLWTWGMSVGRYGIELLGATGTVPIVDTEWIPFIYLVVFASVSLNIANVASPRQRIFPLSLALYVTVVWLVSMLQNGEPRYSALKILLLLSLLAMSSFGATLVERAKALTWPPVLAGLAMVLLWSSVIHESHNGIRGIGQTRVSGTVQSTILEVLSENPNAKIVCLHQSPDQRIASYLCSRLASSFSPGWSRALNEWTSALLNSDISPNGIEIPQVDHVGSQVLARLGEEMIEADLVVILIGGNEAEGVKKDLGPDFWWVQKLNWSGIKVKHL